MKDSPSNRPLPHLLQAPGATPGRPPPRVMPSTRRCGRGRRRCRPPTAAACRPPRRRGRGRTTAAARPAAPGQSPTTGESRQRPPTTTLPRRGLSRELCLRHDARWLAACPAGCSMPWTWGTARSRCTLPRRPSPPIAAPAPPPRACPTRTRCCTRARPAPRAQQPPPHPAAAPAAPSPQRPRPDHRPPGSGGQGAASSPAGGAPPACRPPPARSPTACLRLSSATPELGWQRRRAAQRSTALSCSLNLTFDLTQGGPGVCGALTLQ